jgi:hypothetical protein
MYGASTSECHHQRPLVSKCNRKALEVEAEHAAASTSYQFMLGNIHRYQIGLDGIRAGQLAHDELVPDDRAPGLRPELKEGLLPQSPAAEKPLPKLDDSKTVQK